MRNHTLDKAGSRSGRFRLMAAVFVAVALVAVACSSADSTDTTQTTAAEATTTAPAELRDISFRLNVNATGTHAPFVLARDKGWYAEEGLNVSFGEGSGSDTAVSVIDAGDDDIAVASFDAVAVLRGKGAKVKVVGAWESRSPLAIITQEGSAIVTPKDLEGAKVVMDQGDFPLFEAFASRAGIDASKVELVTITESAQSAALATGRIDGILGWTTYHSPQVAELTGGVGQVLWSDYNFDLMNLSIIASDDMIANDRDMICAIVRVSMRALEYAIDNPDEAIDALMGEFANLNRNIMLGQLVNMFELIGTPNTEGKPLGWVSEDDVASAIGVLSEAGEPLDVEAADLFDNTCFEG